ncbi:hypothetical protein LTR70_001166 [Exophiala xenobiotica]|uniref:Nephrocystin 3-like N-terminal domain-containing protein n=1 Tax=Lithohypha guttulata TaxID=1690604 RepID=A0ABR0K9T8_9EURO|nr:hypothetical protein LTR24_005751 [Lithohypha guttulata]KAK5328141.1 hypothetical protein LTR70_001166 [Exophiala xenobiotica]
MFRGGHVFGEATLSDHAQAVFGDVYTSCADYIQHFTLEQERRALLNALRYHGMHERIIHITTAAPETCDYIWNTIFTRWLMQSQDDTIFWISGKPGSGKSTLMKYIVSSPQTQHFLNSRSS